MKWRLRRDNWRYNKPTLILEISSCFCLKEKRVDMINASNVTIHDDKYQVTPGCWLLEKCVETSYQVQCPHTTIDTRDTWTWSLQCIGHHHNWLKLELICFNIKFPGHCLGIY